MNYRFFYKRFCHTVDALNLQNIELETNYLEKMFDKYELEFDGFFPYQIMQVENLKFPSYPNTIEEKINYNNFAHIFNHRILTKKLSDKQIKRDYLLKMFSKLESNYSKLQLEEKEDLLGVNGRSAFRKIYSYLFKLDLGNIWRDWKL